MNDPALESGALSEEDLLGHGAWIRRFCRALAGPDDGDDLAQETWLAALQKSAPLDRREAARPWLASVARRIAQNRWRRRARRRETSLRAAPPDADPATDEVVERGELTHAIVRMVMELSEPQRTTLLLRYFEGLDSSAIAKRVGARPATVRSHLKRGLEQVREELDRRHRGDRTRWISALIPIVVPSPRARSGRFRTLLPTAAVGFATLLLVVIGLGRESSDPVLPTFEYESEATHEADGDLDLASSVLRAQRKALEGSESPTYLHVSRVRWHQAAEPWVHAWIDKRLLAPPLVALDRVVTGGQRLQCFRLSDGERLWAVPGGNGAFGWVPPRTVVGGCVIAKHTQGGVAAFALESGELSWRRTPEELGSDTTAGLIARARSGRLRYLTGTTSGLAALDPQNGNTLWRRDLGGTAVGIATDGGDVVTGTQGGRLTVLDAADGSTRWSSDLLTPLGPDQPPLCHDELVITLTCQKYGSPSALEAFDRRTGRRLWSRTIGGVFGQLVLAHEEVWIALPGGFVPIRTTDGELLEERMIPTSGPPLGPASVHADSWLYATRDGSSALFAREAQTERTSWSFRPLKDSPTEIFGWTEHDGGLLVTTRAGLFALAGSTAGSSAELGVQIVAEALSSEPGDELPLHEAVFENAHVLASWIEEGLDDDAGLDAPIAAWPERRSALERFLSDRSPAKRRAALLAIASIARRDAGERIEALRALRSRIEELAREDWTTLRVAALKALVALGRGEHTQDDLGLFQDAWSELELGDRVELLPDLLALGGDVIEGRSEELLFELLDQVGGQLAYRCLDELESAELSERLQARVLELRAR